MMADTTSNPFYEYTDMVLVSVHCFVTGANNFIGKPRNQLRITNPIKCTEKLRAFCFLLGDIVYVNH